MRKMVYSVVGSLSVLAVVSLGTLKAAPNVSQPPTAPTVTSWEYAELNRFGTALRFTTASGSQQINSANLINAMTSIGADGWEMVTIDKTADWTSFYFNRAKTN